MSIEVVTRLYTVLLVTKALLLTLLFVRCAYAIYRNHLQHKVRVLLFGMAAFALTSSMEYWLRAWGRVEQWMCGILPTQAHPIGALIALFVADLGLIAWITVVEATTHLGIKKKTD